jgi:iron(III) transport system substrate-binding protein
MRLPAVAALMVVLAMACAPSAAPPAAPQAFAPSTSVGASTGSGSTEADWQTEWDRTVAAAKREGRVVVVGVPGEAYREILTAFQKTYPEIQVEYQGVSGRDFVSKIMAERQADQFLWDVYVAGGDTAVTHLAPAGILDPVKAAVIRPDVLDDSKWLNGFDWGFQDAARQRAFGFAAYLHYAIYVNRDLVPESELASVADLLHPRFKGRISFNEPREAGTGSSAGATVMLALGPDRLRQFYREQDVRITRDLRQQVEWLVRGQQPIGIGVNAVNLSDFQRQGLGLNVRHLDAPDAYNVAMGGGGCGCIVNRPANPNAAKVYLNWLLSQEGQTLWVKTIVGHNSRRLDVEIGDAKTALKPGVEYVIFSREENQYVREEATRIAKETLP